jgi:hypothetical protein
LNYRGACEIITKQRTKGGSVNDQQQTPKRMIRIHCFLIVVYGAGNVYANYGIFSEHLPRWMLFGNIISFGLIYASFSELRRFLKQAKSE